MGGKPVGSTTGQGRTAVEDLIQNFARLLRERYGARVYLFGSRVRGKLRKDSDYDFVAVANDFREQPILHRALDARKLWLQAGGWRIPMDLVCYTPDEFRKELAGLGYIGQAKRRGELVEIKPAGRKPSDSMV